MAEGHEQPIGELIREHGHAAMASLATALGEPSAEAKKSLAEAARQLARLRDGLIEQRRADRPVENELGQVNAILSAVVSQEYPLGGLRHECVALARRALEQLLRGAPPE